MKRSIFRNAVFLLGIAILTMCMQCKKLIKPEDVSPKVKHSLTYELEGFETSIKPMSDFKSNNPQSRQSNATTLLTSGNPVLNDIIYYWNYNNRSIKADIAVYQDNYAQFRRVGGVLSYVPGFHTNKNPHDYAQQFTKPAIFELNFKTPKPVLISAISFDFAIDKNAPDFFTIFVRKSIGSSTVQRFKLPLIPNMKNFDKQNVSFEFPNIILDGAEAFITFDFQLDKYGIKLDRYFEQSTARADNVRLYGRVLKEEKLRKKFLKYYFFNTETQQFELVGDLDENSLQKFSVSLTKGEYKVALIYANVEKDLILPAKINNLQDLQLSHDFSDYKGEIYGLVDTFNLEKPMNRKAKLERLYNQVNFEFTDLEELKDIEKIQITPEKSYLSWQPLFQQGSFINMDLTVKPIIFNRNMEANRKIAYNHFVGKLNKETLIQYKIEVFKKNTVARTFHVKAMARNNMQITFRGRLDPPGEEGIKFETILNERWGESQLINF